MFVRWEVSVCAVLALCSVGAVPHMEPIDPSTGGPATVHWTTTPPPSLPPTQASDCGIPSHRPVALDTLATTWITLSWAQQNRFSLEMHNYSTPLDASISKDGDSIDIDFPNMDSDDAPHIEWKVNDTVIWRMNLTRLSFNWPSEHPLDNRIAFLGLHLEHVTDQGQTWVVTYNYEICDPPRTGFEVVSAAARNISSPGESVSVPGFVVQSLMPYGHFDRMVMCDYFFYEFSESPSMQRCAPSVYWMVYRFPQCVGEGQMNVELLDGNGSYLEKQPPPLEGVPATYFTCF